MSLPHIEERIRDGLQQLEESHVHQLAQECVRRGDELEAARKRIAELEAGRGAAGAELADLIRKRYPRLLERGNPLYEGTLDDAIGRIEEGGPIEAGRVVVAPLTQADYDLALGCAALQGRTASFRNGWAGGMHQGFNIAISRIRAIPADRVLGEGMLSIHPEVLESISETLREIGDMAHNASTGPAIPDILWDIRGRAYDAYTAAADAGSEIVQTANALALRAQAGKDACA